MRLVLPFLLAFCLIETSAASLLKKLVNQVGSIISLTVPTPPAPGKVAEPAPAPVPVAAPAPPTPGFNPSSIADHRVLVRTFFKEIKPEQAQEINFVLEANLDNFTATNSGARKLRASRDLQSFCKLHCNDQKYGCKWCKVNDVYIGADCNNYCRRRDTEEVESRSLQLTGKDELATSYVSNRNRFTPEQDAICAQLLATLELASNVVDAPISETQCFLVPRNFTIPSL